MYIPYCRCSHSAGRRAQAKRDKEMGPLSTQIAPLGKGTPRVPRRVSVTSCPHLHQLGQRRSSSLTSWLGPPHQSRAGPEAQQWPLAPPVALLWPDLDQRLLRLLEQPGPVKKGTVNGRLRRPPPPFHLPVLQASATEAPVFSRLLRRRCDPGVFPLLQDGTSGVSCPDSPSSHPPHNKPRRVDLHLPSPTAALPGLDKCDSFSQHRSLSPWVHGRAVPVGAAEQPEGAKHPLPSLPGTPQPSC